MPIRQKGNPIRGGKPLSEALHPARIRQASDHTIPMISHDCNLISNLITCEGKPATVVPRLYAETDEIHQEDYFDAEPTQSFDALVSNALYRLNTEANRPGAGSVITYFEDQQCVILCREDISRHQLTFDRSGFEKVCPEGSFDDFVEKLYVGCQEQIGFEKVKCPVWDLKYQSRRPGIK